MLEIKSGLKTSEFWVTLLPTIASFLVLTGVIGDMDSTMIISLGKDIIAGIVALVSLVTYIISRTNLKRDSVRLFASPSQQLPLEPKEEVILESDCTEVELG